MARIGMTSVEMLNPLYSCLLREAVVTMATMATKHCPGNTIKR